MRTHWQQQRIKTRNDLLGLLSFGSRKIIPADFRLTGTSAAPATISCSFSVPRKHKTNLMYCASARKYGLHLQRWIYVQRRRRRRH